MVSGGYGQADGTGRLLAGRYRVVARLGRGGMGVVWRALDEVLGREVAVKELRAYTDSAGAELAELRLRMQREARAAARVRHPAVIVVHDIAEVEGRPLIVMELIDGPSLDDVLRERGTLDPREAARVGAEVMDALAAAHRAGVLHRDVKPGNILLDRTGRVVLTDFGIATMDDPGDGSTAQLTRSGELVGSLDYMAPERAMGADPGPASDVWALGAALYAAVEGASPFRRTSTFSTLAAIVDEPLPEPRLAGPLAPVLRRLMDKRPDARPAAEEARELLRTAAREPGADTPTTALRQPAPAAAEAAVAVEPGPDTPVPLPDPPRGPDEGPAREAGQRPAQRPLDAETEAPAQVPEVEVTGGGALGGEAAEAGAGGGEAAEAGAGGVRAGGARDGAGEGAAPAPEVLASDVRSGGGSGARGQDAGAVSGGGLGRSHGAGRARPVPSSGPGRRVRRRAGRLATVAVGAVLATVGLTIALLNDKGHPAQPDAAPPVSARANASKGIRGAASGHSAEPDPKGQGEETTTAPTGDPTRPTDGRPTTHASVPASATASGAGPSPSTATITAAASATATPASACRSAGGGTYTCEVRSAAKSYTASGTKAGKVHPGAHAFYCQADLGRRETHGRWTNVWWARTDDDNGNTGVYISDVYLAGGDNDEPVPGLPVC
ncbi:serine/threonine-protein kinase [Streptomyces humi]|uniref:serine/threonine-protein kinase n=1 Tax=Streptomyces humi TaxID=1428620 RepID=UPI000628707E|nr:serine/threonine-protein kinase [Streptomyces humi]